MFLVLMAIIVFACMGRRPSRRITFGERRDRFREEPSESRRRPSPTVAEQFEEWHRKTHARDGAHDPAPGPEDGEQV